MVEDAEQHERYDHRDEHPQATSNAHDDPPPRRGTRLPSRGVRRLPVRLGFGHTLQGHPGLRHREEERWPLLASRAGIPHLLAAKSSGKLVRKL
jgi:hypothetical protein